MKGATAEPCASTSRPPMPSSTTMIGSIQNFLRSDRKAQKSIRKVAMVMSSIGAAQARGCVHFCGLADDPVAVRGRIEIEREEFLARQPHDEGDGRDPKEIDDAEHDRAYDAAEQQTELEPELVQRREQGR